MNKILINIFKIKMVNYYEEDGYNFYCDLDNNI